MSSDLDTANANRAKWTLGFRNCSLEIVQFGTPGKVFQLFART